MACGNLDVKLLELDGRLARLRGGIAWCEGADPDRLRQEQQLLLDYARLAVTEENVALLARQALAARGQVNASTLVEEYPNDFTGIIGLHTYSQSPHREYDITLTGNWVERGGFRFQDFVLTRRKEVNTDGNH